MTDEGKKLQQANIRKCYDALKEERIVTSKDVAFSWIQSIGNGYDGAQTVGELHAVIDELVAYAIIGYECVD